MWTPPLNPFGNMLVSFLVALTPILTLMILLVMFRIPGYKAALLASLVAFIIALLVYDMPFEMALFSYLYGVLFGLWPISWIVINAMVLFNLAERTGSLRYLERWMIKYTLGNKGIQALFIAFLFGSLIEGVDGYGFPIAIVSALLIRLGFNPLSAVLVALLANTITVPFASLGVPLITLSLVTGLNLHKLAVYASFQLMIFSVIIPFLIIKFVNKQDIWKIIDITLLSGLVLGVMVYLISVYISPYIPGLLAPIISMIFILMYMRIRFRKDIMESDLGLRESIYGWVPWIYVTFLMLVSIALGITKLFTIEVKVPYLHEQVYIELYGKAYSAIYKWSPISHGTLVLCATILTVLTFKVELKTLVSTTTSILRQLKSAILTILAVVGLAFLMNYSGMSLTLGYSLSILKGVYPFAAAIIGWIGTFITGSSTGSNALFGSLQRISAEMIGLSPYLIAATNSTGGVLGKIVSLQSIAIGVSAVNLTGKEGEAMRKLLPYSLTLALLLGLLTFIQSILT